MKIISLDAQNIDQEHICCIISKQRRHAGIDAKKNWLKDRFKEGLKFKKLDVRGKVFIEYLPAEYAWRPISAPGYMFIHCLWVSGRYKGQGYAQILLNECLKDSENMNGVALVTSKQSFLTDKGFFLHNGFEVCDQAPPYFELLFKQFRITAPEPKFNPCAKALTIKKDKGLVIYYSDQCPYFEHYATEMLDVAKKKGIPANIEKIESATQAQQAASAYGTFNVFYDGNFLTHKPMSQSQFEKMLVKII